MSRYRRAILETFHIAALSLWLGVVLMSGLFAAVFFPTMKKLNPSLPDFAAFPQDHWKLAAGEVANKVFVIGTWAQFVLWGLACVTWVAIAWDQAVTSGRVSRTTTLMFAGLALTLTTNMVVLPLGSILSVFRAAALKGDSAAALAERAKFDDLHHYASPAMLCVAAMILVCLVACAFSLGSTPRETTPAVK